MRHSYFDPQFRISHTIGVLRLEARHRILSISDSLLKLLRCKREDVLSEYFFNLLCDSEKLAARANKGLQLHRQWQGRARLKPESTKPFALGPQIHVLLHQLDGHANETIATIILMDSFNRIIDAAIEHSHLDGLTGLANRKKLMHQLEHLFARATPTKPLALLYLDINNFKHFNDQYGHNTGDLLLQEVGQRIQNFAHTECHAPFKYVLTSRIGGDEFCVLFSGTFTNCQMVQLAETFTQALQFDITHENAVLPVRCSVGLALAPKDTDNFTDLLTKADQAMYQAKNLKTSLPLVHFESTPTVQQIPLAL